MAMQDDSEFASDYISFQIPDESFLDVTDCIAVVRGLTNDSSNVKQGRPMEGSCCASLLVTVVWIWLYTRTTCANNWELYQLKDPILHLEMENEKLRSIPHTAVPSLSVSASRGVAYVLAARKRALVYVLDEDEDEISYSE
ncbi:anaphase-promoting complex subunit 4-like [Syzygium oleosum]|uniref:anaphase-promoting complex subunit 4-like n=1 Tax=Syzygium oleosum TaxID=219896 RepID=UPI0024B939AA|nr:anaphase-promoting complex subunit 4-like [Syzygium oleosum]